MNTISTRLVIYTKDVMNLTGRSERTARKMMADIRKKRGKQKGAFITVEDFCAFTGIKEDKVQPFLF